MNSSSIMMRKKPRILEPVLEKNILYYINILFVFSKNTYSTSTSILRLMIDPPVVCSRRRTRSIRVYALTLTVAAISQNSDDIIKKSAELILI